MQSAKYLIGSFVLLGLLWGCGNYTQLNRTESFEREERGGRGENPGVPARFECPAAKSFSHSDRALHHLDEVREYGRRYHIDHRFLLALIQVESSGRCQAMSNAGAYGLFQLTLPTARNYDPAATPKQLFKSGYNINIACRHYRWLRQEFDRHFPHATEYEKMLLVVAAWNAGLRAVVDHGGVPDFPESEELVRRFARKYKEYVRLGV